MKRVSSVLLAVVLGALSTGIGMGVFLKAANDDRMRMAGVVAQSKAEVDRLAEEKQRLVEEANRKLEAANEEVQRAQSVIKAIEEEKKIIANAKTLSRPSVRELRGWQPVVSLAQGLVLRIPPGTEVESNDRFALTAVKSSMASSTSADGRWLSIMPYNQVTERELLSSLTTSTSFTYLVDGQLLTGKLGRLNGAQDNLLVLNVHQAATSTHLIWIKHQGALGSINGMERLLATLEFRS